MRKLKHKEIEQLAQEHTDTLCWSWDSGSRSLFQEHASMYHAILLWYVYKPKAFSKTRGNDGTSGLTGFDFT